VFCDECDSDDLPILKRELPPGAKYRYITQYLESVSQFNPEYTDRQLEIILHQLFFDNYSLLRPAPEEVN
jgi:hypothetical protein